MKFEVLKRSHIKRNIIIALIAIGIISAIVLNFTRAKYRTTQSIPLINGTINYELSDFNLIGAYIQNGDDYTPTNEIPSSGYEFNSEKSYCTVNNENIDVTLNYDMETQTISVVPLTTKGTKCYLYFDEASSATDVIEDIYEENQGMLAYDNTADNNLRYIGRDPNNYVYFNCDDYNNPSNSTCELWRIIGIFNDNSHGISGEKLVKLIRSDSLGNIAWDTANTNNWSTASLQTTLNEDYLNGSGSYASNGIKNNTTRNMIANVTWKLGGTADYQSASNGLASHWYGYERGTTVYSGRPTTWQGKIALMYPSDYGYATSGGATTNRDACLAQALYNWNSSSFSDCKNNDWLFDSSTNQWTLTPNSSNSNYVFFVTSAGYVASTYYANYSRGVRPSVYLTSNVSISGGDGTINNPYILKV
ncbi:MAG TPA: hypothetical protein IAB49_00515 [Candidatus Caccenecus avistercoris]|nr:hypothetical protein [Candidatus Caccenecus avistercoris]